MAAEPNAITRESGLDITWRSHERHSVQRDGVGNDLSMMKNPLFFLPIYRYTLLLGYRQYWGGFPSVERLLKDEEKQIFDFCTMAFYEFFWVLGKARMESV